MWEVYEDNVGIFLSGAKSMLEVGPGCGYDSIEAVLTWGVSEVMAVDIRPAAVE